ncbi:ArsR family transcriptional regulator [Thermococcus sp.]|uniref:ArsR family transcriptional regulator n=1 Tax=Thermococcus sp. TaxID=35749 RepID=UPI0025EC954E|nr:ArsR family transcriptional regulator [Thermococcus sp.]
MLGRHKDVVYRTLATKKRAVALQHLSSELETSMPAVLETVRQLESEGLAEVFYGQNKARVMVRAKTLEDYV